MSKEKIFETNGNIEKNAYMNWNMNVKDKPHNFQEIANCYANSAKYMMEMILQDNSDKKADSLIFPIFYSIDQSIEVYLKAIIAEIEELNDGKINNYTHHDIKGLYNQLISMIGKKEDKTKGLEKHFTELKQYIYELYSYIKDKKDNKPNIDFARYPVDSNGNPHFYLLNNDNVVVDIEKLLEQYEKIHLSLEGVYVMYEEEREYTKYHD